MNKSKLYLLLLCVFAVNTLTYAQEKRYQIGNSTNVLSNFRRQLATLKSNSINRLQLQLSSTRSLPAVINYRRSLGAAHEQLTGSIANVPNSSFFLTIDNKSVQGHILLRDSKKAYAYSSDNNGAVFVQETDINKVICIDYQEAVEPVSPPVTAAKATTVASAAALADLQSFPGANGCVLLDFDGQNVSGTAWNNNGPINALPANLTDAQKQDTWELVSEAFSPFSLNITTSEAVFNTYPQTKRMRCIFTPTNTVAPGSGGVAFIGTFNWGDLWPCWVFNSRGKAVGDAAVHEIGHTLDLIHDGRPGEEYYQGQGNWAPIMGVGYSKSLVQWSKGEYANANNTEDDLAIISTGNHGVGYRADDYGNTTTASTLVKMDLLGNVSNKGIIERTADVDMFSFSTSGGVVNFTFTPNVYYPMLDILATLYDNNGTAITTSDPAGLNAAISTTLTAGTYYVSVTGTGLGSPAATGYSNYASLGNYAITGTIPIHILLSKDSGMPLKDDNSPSSKQVNSFVVSPNPAVNQVKLQYGKRGSYFDVKITAVNGAIVYTASHIQTGQQINVASLKAGLYFITIYTGKEIITKRLIKQNAN
jgi:hypothetical protein